MGGLRFERWWGREIFSSPHSSRLALHPIQPPVQWVLGLLPGEERPGRGVDRPTPSSTKVHERVVL